MLIGGVDPIEAHHVNMGVEPQGRVKTLNERHRPALRLTVGAKFSGPANQEGKNRPREDAEDSGHQ